jgi:thiol:disulfide interchange protein
MMAALPLLAQPKREDPVQWKLETDVTRVAPGGKVLARFTAAIAEGWHLYSPTTPPGPIPTELKLADSPYARLERLHQPKPNVRFDPNFNTNLETYDGGAVFLMEIAISAEAPAGELELAAQARYQACSDTQCLRPVRKTATAKIEIVSGAGQAAMTVPPGYVEVALGERPAAGQAGPVKISAQQNQGLTQFLAVAFGFGLAAVFTPCVFPMIPITMSFFLKRGAATRGESITQATIFCLGIVVLFTGLGLLTTAVMGPFGVVQMGSNPWVNLFIALVFGLFGLSLLGAFEITLPSGLLTKMDQASQRGGTLGTLLMGLTFSLTSFACVGPFVGPLLAASVQEGGLRPAAGMATFAAGLAAPFFLLALFPAYLQRMPKSGGWLPRVKVVLGFIIVAVMFKYLSNIDQVMQWNLLTRERFLAIWVVLFAMPGLYLLGLLKMDGIKPDETVGATRALMGSVFLIFALAMVPGMFGGRLGELDAYVPLAEATAGSRAAAGPQWMKNDYEGALEKAKAEGKLVFVSFTGYACTNCHWMKANMFPRPEVASALEGFVLVELYTDGTDAVSEKYQQLQDSKFTSSAIPLYAIMTAEGNVVAHFVGLTKNAPEFVAFIKSARG